MLNAITKLVLFVCFPCAICVGTWAIADYSNRPCDRGTPSLTLDPNQTSADLLAVLNEFAQSELRRTDSKKLLVFYHPHCPCTAASLRNLQRINSSLVSERKIYAFAFHPQDEPVTWIESPTTKLLRGIPNITIIPDREAIACQAFGLSTSGHMLVYDEAQRLIFSGGITPGRGHEGDCQSSFDLRQKINGEKSTLNYWPVYGCSIVESEEKQ